VPSMTNPLAEDSSDLARQRFAAVFGVSEAELIARGVDPGEYAATHIGDAMKHLDTRKLLLSRSTNESLTSNRLAWRAYVAIFVGFAFLFVSLVRPLHWFGIAAASVSGAFAITLYVIAMRHKRLSRRTRKTESAN